MTINTAITTLSSLNRQWVAKLFCIGHSAKVVGAAFNASAEWAEEEWRQALVEIKEATNKCHVKSE